jgi:glycosyltransferase involved in cell wall biosynthesis
LYSRQSFRHLSTTAICCFYEAYPPASGAASVSYNLAKFFPGDSLLVQLGRRDQKFVTTDGVHIVTLAGATESRRERLTRLPRLIRRMLAEIAKANSPVIILEGASWAIYHWLLSLRLRRTAPQRKIIYHSHNVEYLLRVQRHGQAVARFTLWAEGRLLRQADLATAVSEVDRDHFARLYGVRPVLLPNGVDVERFAHPDLDAVNRMKNLYRLDRQTLVFSGFYAYPPNREAIDFLVRSVMPALRKRCPFATLALTGEGVPYQEPWIRNVGSIEYRDFAAFIKGCGIAVAPIFTGSGTRLKILEAMAAGIPVVATQKAAEGLSLIHGEDVLFARDTLEFVNSLTRLLDNPELAAALRDRARLTVARFSWKRLIRDVEPSIFTNELKPQLEAALAHA